MEYRNIQFTWRDAGAEPDAGLRVPLPRSKSVAAAMMGLRLKRIRTLKGLTQQALGEIMGASNTAVQAWEVGRNAIDPIGLGWAADALGCSTDYVIRGEIGGMPFDLAIEIQTAERAEAANSHIPAKRRGRPPKTPLVRDLPDPTLAGAPRTNAKPKALHAPVDAYIPPSKPRSV